MDEIINNFMELKKWKKVMFGVMIFFICAGVFFFIFGIAVRDVIVPMMILGAVFIVSGALIYMFARHSLTKAEKMIVKYLESSSLPPDEILDIMTKIKS